MSKVQVQQGWLEGEVLDLITGNGRYHSFKGIPYAAPPLGKLRFKAPEPPQKWEGIRKATSHGAICMQKDIFTNELLPGSEDCLYLNVYTQDLTPKSPLPVMVFIHGGGYKSGSGNENHYGPDFLVQHGVVLVTINYRLDALGFLCLDTEEVPGNAGLKDQAAALVWVKENISSFGGDPNNVTIFGESAGGASVIFHLLSPMSKGLFSKGISMSGVPTCDWSHPFMPRERAFVLGKQLGLETDDVDELLQFLQSVPAEKLVDTNPTLISSEIINNNLLKMYHFTPVAEKDFGHKYFLNEPPMTAIKNGRMNEANLLIGLTSEETLIGTTMFAETVIKEYDSYPEMVVPREIQIKSNPESIIRVASKIRKQYFGKKSISVENMKEFVRYANESCFIYDVVRTLRSMQKVGKAKTYMYRFSCVSERNVYGNLGRPYGIIGASHLDDCLYLFDPKSMNLKLEKDSKEYELVQLVNRVFTNFAKFGTPTPDSSLKVTWPEYDNSTRQFVDIGDQLTLCQDPYPEVFEFWRTIFEEAGVEY